MIAVNVIRYGAIVGAVSLGFAIALACGKKESSSEKSLKDLAAAKGIRIGAFYHYDSRSSSIDAVFEREYNALTAYLFWNVTHNTDRATFDFSETDEVVNWATARGMEIYGQTFAWFEELPSWFKALPNSEVEAAMNEFIDALIGRYKGKIKYWNVVNEAIDPNGNYRTGHKWHDAMGNAYISKAFHRARSQDASAVLYYNEFDIEGNSEANTAKYAGVKSMLQNLLNSGVPVHALGWQMHVKPGSFDSTILLARFNEVADMGLDNYITELDVELPTSPTADDYEKQKQTYKSIISTFLKSRRHKSITIWGIRDGQFPDWLPGTHQLPFDENLQKKSAYIGIQEALTE